MPDDGNRDPVKSKSVRNVPNERLSAEHARLHSVLHTPEGLRTHDGPRRDLIDNGMKSKMISHEMVLRGQPTGDCKHCQPPSTTMDAGGSQ